MNIIRALRVQKYSKITEKKRYFAEDIDTSYIFL